MSYEVLGAGALDYAPCRYDGSRILFRGPLRRLDQPYVAFLGGTDTYGKFIEAPFPALLENTTGINCVNFGVANAGVDVFLSDNFLRNAANSARVTVLQVVGAQNLSNRFYTVHPRRNDRFLKASETLMAIFPEIDFSEFHFTRHMLSALYAVSPDRFVSVRNELQQAWTNRMKTLCRMLEGKTLLLWFSEHAPLSKENHAVDPIRQKDPWFVTRHMLRELSDYVSEYQEVVASQAAVQAGTKGMVFSEMEALATRRLLGPQAHAEAAAALGPTLLKLT